MGDGQDTAQRQIENYALIGNCETAALVGRRVYRLAVLAPFRFGRVLRRLAWQTGARKMAHRAKRLGSPGQTTLPRSLAYPRDDLRDS
jgi:hypothetical protein